MPLARVSRPTGGNVGCCGGRWSLPSAMIDGFLLLKSGRPPGD